MIYQWHHPLIKDRILTGNLWPFSFFLFQILETSVPRNHNKVSSSSFSIICITPLCLFWGELQAQNTGRSTDRRERKYPDQRDDRPFKLKWEIDIEVCDGCFNLHFRVQSKRQTQLSIPAVQSEWYVFWKWTRPHREDGMIGNTDHCKTRVEFNLQNEALNETYKWCFGV